MKWKWLAVILFVICLVPTAALADDWSDCLAGDPDNSPMAAPDAVIEACSKVIDAPGVPDERLKVALRLRGVGYGRKNELRRAIQDFEKALKIDPEFAQAWNSRGTASRRLGRLVEAMRDYNQAIALDPHYATALRNRAELLLQAGKCGKALDDIQKSLKFGPASAWGLTVRGEIHFCLGDRDKAMADFEQARARSQGRLCLLRHRLFAAFEWGLPGAIASYDRALQTIRPPLPRCPTRAPPCTYCRKIERLSMLPTRP